jgi:hypothetical protein
VTWTGLVRGEAARGCRNVLYERFNRDLATLQVALGRKAITGTIAN